VQLSPSTFVSTPGAVVADRYRLGQLLGRGGMAEVYDGVDLRLERAVAIKLLRPEMVAREDVRSRFQAEARAAAGMSHPNAVAVFDTGEHEGVPYLVMERLPGDTLADLVAAGPVDVVWLRGAAQGLLGALAAAHGAGIVHRDVKPGNVLIARDGTAKITDFGIAKSIHPADDSSGNGRSDLTATGQLLGTPAYLAPERLEGKPATPRSDLWAFGVVMYEALAGRKPFVGRNPLEVAHAIVTGNYVPLAEARPDLDPALVAAVERAMATDPDARFATADEMAEAVDGDGDGAGGGDGTMVLPVTETRVDAAGTTALRTSRAPSGPRRRSRAPLVWLGIALAVILAMALLGREAGPFVPAVGDRATTTVAAQDAPRTLPERMRELAGRLEPERDGARARDLADGLRRVADELEANRPTAAGQATGLIISVGAWRQSGQLSDVAAAAAIDLLRQVPGVQTQARNQSQTPVQPVQPTQPRQSPQTTAPPTPTTQAPPAVQPAPTSPPATAAPTTVATVAPPTTAAPAGGGTAGKGEEKDRGEQSKGKDDDD
jgi:tRNA A-37 threonylcarbamoyl transferase component Bud32